MDNGVNHEKPVRYFVMGRNEWRESDQWLPAAVETPMFFAPSAGGVSSGRLQATQFEHRESFSQFLSDPANPVTNSYDSSGAHDYARLSERADVLTFDSAALKQDTEVTGPISVHIWVSCDCRDFDLWARLLDVAGHEPDESGARCAARQLSRLEARPTVAIPRRNLRTEVRETDYEQRVFAGTSDPAADLGKFHSKLFTQSPERTIGGEQRGDEKSKYPGVSRCLPPVARTAAHYLDPQIRSWENRT
jgi:predicted acyl esterase